MWTWIRTPVVSAALLAAFATTCAAQSLHLAPTGTVVSGSFELAGKAIPLPEGEFLLAATRIDEARLKSAVWASTVLEPPAARTNWVQAREPCARENVLFRLDLAQDTSRGEYAHQNCLVVERRARSFGAASTGIMKDAAAWLAYHDVVLPVPVLIVAEMTRIERRELVRVAYAFNPWSYGCNRPSPPFVESIIALGKGLQQHFDDLLMGRRAEPSRAGLAIHQCASALASAGARQ
ncbi:MAG: hypothetical protein E6H63_07630 [Betaproteobacteria bacterium]|nr:MAG: hypothetical protein E6H63_07630 [Betaproteobacteria bacterium]